jgi:hypothetical protein
MHSKIALDPIMDDVEADEVGENRLLGLTNL